MGVFIKDMEMPKYCFECPFAFYSYYRHGDSRDYSCCITKKPYANTRRSKYCPLIEVKTIAELEGNE